MRISILFFLGFNFIINLSFAQTDQDRKSALVKKYSSDKLNELDSKIVLSEIDNQVYVSAFIKVNSEFNSSVLIDFGVIIGTVAGDILTVKIPIERLNDFINYNVGIEFIELDQPTFLNLEAARSKTNVDMVHNGISLPQGYSGKDVVIGVLDVGFDYSHPTFYDETGVKYRVKRIWEQKVNGTPPINYSYGNEITDTIEMLNRQTDNNTQSHGTHVAGIAAGSGYGGISNKYRGIAYESDLVLVGITPTSNQWTNTGMTDIIDGLNYVYDYAFSVGKPAVVNLSWGCTIGPHDGSSLFSQAVNNLTGPGRIFTISAGNNGGDKIHISKEFNASDTILQSFANIKYSPGGRKTWIDIWGEQNEAFCVNISTYFGTTENNSTGYFCVDNSNMNTFILGSDNDTLFINATGSASDLNGKPHILLDLYNKSSNRVAISIKGKSGLVNAWMGYVNESTGVYGDFLSYNVPNFIEGDDKMTIGEMACTESAITVAAYASKNTFTNISGQNSSYSSYVLEDDICPFSSHGPSLNSSMKPDISAPGMTIASSVNSYDNRYLPGGSSYGNVVQSFLDPSNNQTYYFGEMSGTSMSSPIVAGIIALVLEGNASATPQDVKMLIKYNAIKDAFTTQTPDENIWGSGKIDAYAMLSQIDNLSITKEKFEFNSIYPNPFSDYIEFKIEGEKEIKITNNLGEVCLNIITTGSRIETKTLQRGVYFMTIKNEIDGIVTQQKLIKF